MKTILGVIKLLGLIKKRNIAIAILAMLKLILLFFPDTLTLEQYEGVRDILDWALFGGAVHSIGRSVAESKKDTKEAKKADRIERRNSR